jgi:predicted transcriptional regulator
VLGVVAEMKRCVYTHVPILEEGRVMGVFSENTIFCALAAKEAVNVTDGTRISEFREFVPISKHVGESFEFAASDITLEAVAQLFAERLRRQQRLGAVFLTDDGTEAGRLLSLMTAWDVAGASELAVNARVSENPV